MKVLITLLFLLATAHPVRLRAQVPAARPLVGLTLGGGGARGLAHIGLLKALDSAQVRVDYISGTSMGAVVGSLYSVGYSGAEIEQIAKGLDWNTLLTNAPLLSTIAASEKVDFGRYIAEIPFRKGAFQLPGGLIESEELWLKLSELLFPFYRTKNFNEFQREFRCIATDVITGEPVVLQKGNVVSAVRASMAIPSVFSPVQYQGHTLVDGGIVRNFPVSEAKAMGASFIIGSNVSAGAYTVENLRTPIDVMLQISSFKDNSDFAYQKSLCNIYVDYPLDGYSSGSFAAAPIIIGRGLQRGRQLYPRLRAWNDSLAARYGPLPLAVPVPRADSVYVAGYEVKGLDAQLVPLLLQLMHFQPKRYYSAAALTTAVRNAFGTRYFRKITYTLQPVAGTADAATIVFEVERAPPTLVGLGLHYNTLTGIGLIVNVSSKDLLLPFSTSQATVNIGENPRLRLKHTQYLTKNKRLTARLLAQGERVSIATYDPAFTKAGLYTQGYVTVDGQLARLLPQNQLVGLGARYERLTYQPEITSRLQLDGKTSLLNSYLFYEANTLNAVSYPTRGHRLYVETGYVFSQRPSFNLLLDSMVIANENSAGFSYRPYSHSRLLLEHYLPLTSRSTLLVQVQAGVNLNYKQAITNDFVVGGLTSVLHNQVTFAGLPEASLFTSSTASLLLGYQRALTQNLYVTGKANALYHDFIADNVKLQPAGTIYGGSLTLGLRTFLGAIDASLLYSGLSKKVIPYFNIGIPFGYQ